MVKPVLIRTHAAGVVAKRNGSAKFAGSRVVRAKYCFAIAVFKTNTFRSAKFESNEMALNTIVMTIKLLGSG